MADQILQVRKGIWIDERWLRNAGLGAQLQVVVQPGEIRILTAPPETRPAELSVRGWDAFRSLGQDAQPGRLPNAAVEHDRYLYGKSG
jgi:hypothetical protein